MTRIEVCPVGDLKPGERRIVAVSGREIGVFNVDGDFHALLNDCAHQHGPVCEGHLQPAIDAEYVEAGEWVEERLERDRQLLVCPWHGWAYDVETGDHTGGSGHSLPTFDVDVEDGVVYVSIE